MTASAATLRQERRKRFTDAVHLEVPDRVPVEIAFPDPAKQLIDHRGRDGGFITSSRTPVGNARPENLNALIDFTAEYGRYV
jgi:hypothetical protein